MKFVCIDKQSAGIYRRKAKRLKRGYRMISGKKIFIGGLCLCLSMTCFTACGKRDVDYYEEGTGTESSMLTEEQGAIPEHVTEEQDDVKVDADIVNGGYYGTLPVLVMQFMDWSTEDVQQYAEAVFDEGSAEVVVPYTKCSKDYLNAALTEVETQITELGFTYETILQDEEYSYLGNQKTAIIIALEEYDESNVVENDGSYQWLSTIYNEEMYNEGEIEVLTCQIKGTIGGEEYVMVFRKEENSYTLDILPINGTGYAERDYSEGYDVNATAITDEAEEMFPNVCTLTRQEAEQQAKALIAQLGIEDMALTAIYPARQYKDEYNEELNDWETTTPTEGYLVYFGRSVNGCTTPCTHSYLSAEGEIMVYDEATHEYSFEPSRGYEGIKALVTDDGIEFFQYYNPMEVSEVAVEQASVTAFDSIHERAMEYMVGGSYKIDSIRLCMGVLREDESYALIPVWCYEYDVEGLGLEIYRKAVMVNAIDGSIIDEDSGQVVQE